MAVSELTVKFGRESLRAVQELIRELGLDGWLLYDFHGVNPIASGVLGLPALSRRFFVLIPAEGPPIALTHRIEQQPWRGWIGENRQYLSWQSLAEGLAALLDGSGTIAVEWSPGDGVPYLDRVPGGVLELIHSAGVRTVSSGDLVSAFYSRWTDEGEASHRRAAQILRDTAYAAFARIGDQLRGGDTPTEWAIRQWVVEHLVDSGLSAGADAIVGVDGNAANPHYAPAADAFSPIPHGSLVLLDLWGKESADGVFADQTWMAFTGANVPDRVESLWSAVRDARDAAVELIRSRSASGAAVAGFEVDETARGVIRERGLGEFFLHRTGHSIDRELHGSGPNIDNLETRDTRRLMPGIGFSIEPGVYIEGEVGMRSEINVYMTVDGPDVTTPEPQLAIHRITFG
jgi:Xaa-Pro aminopeptidase